MLKQSEINENVDNLLYNKEFYKKMSFLLLQHFQCLIKLITGLEKINVTSKYSELHIQNIKNKLEEGQSSIILELNLQIHCQIIVDT